VGVFGEVVEDTGAGDAGAGGGVESVMLSKLRGLLTAKKPLSQPQSTPASTTSDSPVSAPGTASWDGLFQQAQSLQQQGQLERAIELFGKCVELAPDRAEAYYKRANALNGLGRLEPALEDYDRAISLNPSYAYALCNRGLVLERLGRRDEALASYDRAIELDPKDALTHYNRGSVLKDLERYADALLNYEAAIGLKGDFAEAHANRGNVLQELRRHEAAMESFERAIALQPTMAEAFQGRGICLLRLNRLEQALAAFNKAIALKPDLAAAYLGRGNLLADADRHAEAANDYLKATELKPDYAEAYFQRAYSQRMLNRFDLAAADYKVVANLAPDFEFLPGNRLDAALQVCDWSDFDTLVKQVAAGIENDARVAHPVIVMALTDSARLQQKAARTWVSHSCPADGSLGPIAPRARPRKITVGYFSADFHEHPIGRLLAELIEIHDRSRFEVIAFSCGPSTQDEAQQRLVRAFDRFIEVREKSHVEIAALARSLNVDLAVDLGGYTFYNRADIFALRAAPVQVSYLGYLGTLAASHMDYIVADRTVVTPESEGYYSERIIYLPDTHQANDRKRRIADRIFTRNELGLPEKGFVFCCFNSSYKISPKTFAGWMRILKAVPGSVLLLYANQKTAETNLRAHSVRHGVDPQRLVFGERLPPAEYLARYRAADLFLDTLPYNAGTTASDALWAGLPVLTLTGEAFASRIAASLLSAIGVPELITSTQQQYEQLAIELASNPQRLAGIRTRIQDNRLTSPLFDTPLFARNLEAAYTAIHDRYQAGLPPDHIRL
jgi:predicted O-linked N-acetylglucosamine transferase (SPINDLY family)